MVPQATRPAPRGARRWFAAAAAASTAAAAALLLGGGLSPAAAAPAAYQAPIRSGLAWPSGEFVDDWDPALNNAFAAWRGPATDVAVTWPARATWTDFTNSNGNYTAYQGQPFTMVFGIPPIPEDGASTMAACAAGSYNSHWTTFGNTLKGLGLGSSIIRLGWEFNGDWYAWGGGSPATFANCWKQIVTTVRAVAPSLKFDWTVNRGSSAGMPGDAVLSAYPGDSYVDIVGIDNYDHWGDWNTQLNGDYGLQYWLNFALAHGKKLSVPEWGIYPGDTDNGYGDDPAYIQHMHDFFAANASNIAYEAYFNEPSDYIADSIWNPDQNPNSSTVYHSLYSAARVGQVKSALGGNCLTAKGGASANGTPVTITPCSAGGTAQQWTIASDGTLRVLGKCLHVTGSGTANGTLLELWACNTAGAPAEHWTYTAATGALVNPLSGKCLDDPASTTTSGTQLQIYTCNGTNAQHWTLPA
jgi:hypothetical protein